MPRQGHWIITRLARVDCAATRIDIRVVPEYLEGDVFLGRYRPWKVGDLPDCALRDLISHVAEAAEHVIFWAVNVDGVDLLIKTTYPPELAGQFQSMLEILVESIEFER